MKWWWKTLICTLFLNPLFFLSAATIDYSLYFPAVVQGQSGHDNSGNCKNALNPQLTVNENSRINGTLSNSLKFCTIQDNNSGKSCDTNAGGSRSCTITGNNSLGLNLGQSGFLTPSSNSQPIIINSNDCPTGSYILDGSVTQFSSLTINVTCNVILNAASSDYIFGSITLNSDSTLTLPVGNFWIQSLTVNQGNIVLSANAGRRQVYVQNALKINTTKGLNYNGSSADLLLIAYNNVIFNTASENHLYLYSDTVTTLNSSAVIYGRVTTNQLVLNKGTINDAVVVKSTIDHYEIRYPDSQITCEPATIRINACTNSDTASCTKDTAASSSITLSAPASGWSSNPLTLTNGTATVSLSHYTAENVKLGLSGSAYTCFKNDVVDSTCELPFISSALSFDIPTFTAGGNSDDVTLKAIKSDGSGTCSALLSGAQPISFTNSYVTPTTVADLPQIINASTSVTTTISSNTPVVLTFDSNGVATFKLAYNNAGVLNIAAQYTKANTDTGIGTLTVFGSDTVAVLPAAIHVEPTDSAAICSNATYASCTKYKTVGDNFTLNAEAGYGNGAAWKKTSNFSTNQMSSLPVLQHQLVAPAPPAGTLPALAQTALTFAGGTATVSISESDVGVYQYGVTDLVPYPNYQNESPKKMVPLSWSSAIGRFVPAKLKTTLLSHGAFTSENCKANAVLTSLGYVGQELQFAALPMFSVIATDNNGNTLQNYRDDFAKITTANPTATGIGAFTASLVSKDNTTLNAAATWKTGSWLSASNVHTYSFGDDRFTFTKTASHVTPFTTVLTLSALADSDGVVAISSASPFYFYPWAADNSSAFNVYDGRLVLNSVNGAENAALPLPFYMQYWNGSAYAINSADNCTSLTSNALQMNNLTSWTGIPLRVASATSGVATTTASLSPAKVLSGAGAISFTAPNAAGWVDIAASSSLPDWMKDFTLPSGLTPARASFGYYHGNDRLIYRREVFGGQ